METRWKKARDAARNALEAETVVTEALRDAGRAELLHFLGELYAEFVGPDEAGGGEAGTLDAMRRVHDSLQSTNAELVSVGVNPGHLSAYLRHDEPINVEAVQQAVA